MERHSISKKVCGLQSSTQRLKQQEALDLVLLVSTRNYCYVDLVGLFKFPFYLVLLVLTRNLVRSLPMFFFLST